MFGNLKIKVRFFLPYYDNSISRGEKFNVTFIATTFLFGYFFRNANGDWFTEST